jgi:signal transduction histidine kinase
VTAVTTAAAVTLVLVGAYLLALAALVYRRHDGPGVGAFATFVALFAAGGFGAGVLTLAGRTGPVGVWLLQCTELGSLAWFVFAVRYTGRDAVLTRWRLVALVGVYVVVWPPAWSAAGASATLVDVVGVVTNLYGVVLTLAGVTVLVQTTNRHGVLDARVGVVLGAVAFVPWGFADWFALVGTTPSTPVWYAVGFVALGGLLSLAVLRMDALATTAATLPLGRRALRSGTDDLVVVADGSDRVVEVNDAVRRTLGDRAERADGRRVASLLGTSPDALRGTDVLTLDTVEGRREFDVQAVDLGADGSLGTLLSLRDVTRRRQREQGLDVLNRLLRHNLRNELSVIDGRTTLVADRVDDPATAEHLDAVQRSTGSLAALSDKAAAVSAVFDATDDPSRVDVGALVETAAGSVTAAFPAAEVATEASGDVTLTTNEQLLYLAVENVVENAVEHGSTGSRTGSDDAVEHGSTSTRNGEDAVEHGSTSTRNGEDAVEHVDADGPAVAVTVDRVEDGVRVRVDDEGEGVPPAERAVIERETETELDHGSGLGLWVTNWAVTSCGGTLAFGTHAGGGRVTLWVPDRAGR